MQCFQRKADNQSNNQAVIPGEATVHTSTRSAYLKYFHQMAVEGICGSVWKDRSIRITVLPIDIRQYPALEGAKELVLEYW